MLYTSPKTEVHILRRYSYLDVCVSICFELKVFEYWNILYLKIEYVSVDDQKHKIYYPSIAWWNNEEFKINDLEYKYLFILRVTCIFGILYKKYILSIFL